MLDAPVCADQLEMSYTFKSSNPAEFSLLLLCTTTCGETNEPQCTSFHLVNEEGTTASPPVEGSLVVCKTMSTARTPVDQSENAWLTRSA